MSDAPPAGPEPPPWLWAISDVHTDHAANLAWLRRMCARDAFRRDGLILAGDVSSRFSILRETLELCKSAFAEVSFVVGNHDLWATKSEPWADSLARLDAVDALCDELGVHRAPALVGGCVVAPIYAWHHASFDKEPDVTGWSGLPAHNKCLSDFFLAKFPGLDQTTDSVAEALDARNGDLEDRDAALRQAHPALLLLTFSHFVPRPELVPDKRYLFVPALAKAVGSTFLQRRVASYDRTFTSSATRTSAGMRRWTAPATHHRRGGVIRARRAGAATPQRGRHVRAALPVRLERFLRREPAATRPGAYAAGLRREAVLLRAGRRRGGMGPGSHHSRERNAKCFNILNYSSMRSASAERTAASPSSSPTAPAGVQWDASSWGTSWGATARARPAPRVP